MLANYVLETANAPGNAVTVNLGGAVPGRRSFAASFATGSTVFYAIEDGTIAEMGIGVFNAGSPNTLSRNTVLWNTSGTTGLMNFGGPVRVYNSLPAERAIYLRSDGTVQNATAVGSALVRAADAAAARTAINAAVTPLNAAAIGQWTAINNTLPAGGTWAYFAQGLNGSGFVANHSAGVAAGGTVVVTGQAFYNGFAWRIS